MAIKKQNLKILSGVISILIGVLSFYLLFSFVVTESNVQRIFMGTGTSDIFIPNYYAHALNIFGAFFISCFISLLFYRRISRSSTRNKVGTFFLIAGLGCVLVYVSLPFSVFKTNSFVVDSLFSKKHEVDYSQVKSAVINSVITYHSKFTTSGGYCRLEHGVSFPGFLDYEIVLRMNNHEKIKTIREILEHHNVNITYESSIQKGCIEKFDSVYLDRLKGKLTEDLSR